MDKMLDMTMKINCKNKEEAKIIEKEIRDFKRRIKYIKKRESAEQFDYEVMLIDLEDGKVKITRNER